MSSLNLINLNICSLKKTSQIALNFVLIVFREKQVFTDGSMPSDSEHIDEYVSLGGEADLEFHRIVGGKSVDTLIDIKRRFLV